MSIKTHIIEMSGVNRGVKGQTPEGLMLQGIALLLQDHEPQYDLVKDIVQFHQKFDLNSPDKPSQLSTELLKFRIKFMREELNEYVKSSGLEGKLDALVDLVYVAIGTAYLHGFDFNEAWRRVHEANMKKVRAQSADESKRGTSFDVVKPEGWTAPDLSDLV